MRQPLLVAVLFATASCGGDGSKKLPAGPSPSPASTVTFTLTGAVSETAPTQSVRIAGATVTIIDGPLVGTSATTDANGSYQLAVPRGDTVLVVRAANHVERYVEVTLSDNRTLALELDPVAQTVTSTMSGTITVNPTCPGPWDGFDPSDPCKTDYVINVHYDGTLTGALTRADRDNSPILELYRAENGHPSQVRIAVGANTPGQEINAQVLAHTQYVLQVRQFSYGGPAVEMSHTLTVTHPN